MMRLLRPPLIGILRRSFRLHSDRYARETIAAICSMRVALVTAPMSRTGSAGHRVYCRAFATHPL
jgi:hypothetical protein